MDKNEFRTSLEAQIAKGKLIPALRAMREFADAQNGEAYRKLSAAALKLASRFNRLETQKNLSEIRHEEYELQFSRILNAVVSLKDQVISGQIAAEERNIVTPDPLPEPFPTGTVDQVIKVFFAILMCLGGCGIAGGMVAAFYITMVQAGFVFGLSSATCMMAFYMYNNHRKAVILRRFAMRDPSVIEVGAVKELINPFRETPKF